MKITVSGFGGENRAVQPKLLPETVGTVSTNQKPGRGDLRPWKLPSTVATVPGGRNTIYRMGRDVLSDAQYWLSWTGVVHAVRGYDIGDTTERTYYTGDGVPKITDNILGLSAAPYPTANRTLGVPAPTTPLTATPTGGSGDTTTRSYLYTYVTDKGEESAPGPASTEVNVLDGGTVDLSGIASPPGGSHGINRVRIYRTQTGEAGDTEFYFLREIASGVATSTDDNRALGEVLPTQGWLVPPTDLSYLTAMWNGMVAGISGNGVRYAVAYKPYAWPAAYETLPPDAKPVALGKFGQSLLILTTGKPMLVSGSSPDSLDEQPVEMMQACISPRSARSVGHGVVWAAPDGLAYFGSEGPKLLTSGLMLKEDWALLNPSTMIGGVFEGLYVCMYETVLNSGTRKAFIIDPANPTGVYFFDTGYAASFFDELQDALYVLNGTSIQKWDAGAAMTYTFRSKEFRVGTPVSMGRAEVVAETYPVTLRVRALDMTAAEVAALVSLKPLLTAIGTTGVQYTVSVTGRDSVPLPSGFAATTWQIELTGTSPVQGVAIASTNEELAQV